MIAALLFGVAEAASAVALQVLANDHGIRFTPRHDLIRLTGARKRQAEAAVASWDPYDCDPALGWTVKPSSEGKDPFGLGSGYRANAAGMFASREFDPTVPPGVLRVAGFGHYTAGRGAGPDGAWPAQLMRRSASIEALNFGVDLYGPDQAYLRYLADGRRFRPRVVVLTFSTNDLAKTVKVFMPWDWAGSTAPLVTKPGFRVENKELVKIDSPLHDVEGYRRLLADPEAVLSGIARIDANRASVYGAGPFDFLRSVRIAKIARVELAARRLGLAAPVAGTDVYEISTRILTRFARAAQADHALPLFVAIPHGGEIFAGRSGVPAAYAPIVDYLRGSGLGVIDMLGPMAKLAEKRSIDELATWGAYSPAGHEAIADAIFQHLQTTELKSYLAAPPGDPAPPSLAPEGR